MGLFHLASDDDTRVNADAGLKKALMRLNELADLLEEASRHGGLSAELHARIRSALLREYRDGHYEEATNQPWQWERQRRV